jgi:hypothetical protein
MRHLLVLPVFVCLLMVSPVVAVAQPTPDQSATDSDGYKAVDYSKLPLLTIQAMKELKAENDALKQRVTELERLVGEMLAANARR